MLKLELNIQAADFDLEFAKIMEQLSQEDKKDIAIKIYKNVLDSYTNSEKGLREKERNAIESTRNYLNDHKCSDDVIRNHWKYNAIMKGTKSSKEKAIEMMIETATNALKEEILTLIREDEGLKIIMDEMKKQLVSGFPQLILTAMTMQFAKTFEAGMMSEFLNSQNHNLQNQLNEIKRGLAERGILV